MPNVTRIEFNFFSSSKHLSSLPSSRLIIFGSGTLTVGAHSRVLGPFILSVLSFQFWPVLLFTLALLWYISKRLISKLIINKWKKRHFFALSVRARVKILRGWKMELKIRMEKMANGIGCLVFIARFTFRFDIGQLLALSLFLSLFYDRFIKIQTHTINESFPYRTDSMLMNYPVNERKRTKCFVHSTLLRPMMCFIHYQCRCTEEILLPFFWCQIKFGFGWWETQKKVSVKTFFNHWS